MNAESWLGEAHQLLQSDQTLVALDRLLACWEDLRSAELAECIDRLGQQIDRSLPALESSAALREQWIDLASKRRPADLGRLLAAFPEAGSIPVFQKRVELLELFPNDPRIPAALLPVACRYSSYSSDPLRTRVYRLVKRIADPRSLAEIDQQLAQLEQREGLLRDKPRLIKLRDALARSCKSDKDGSATSEALMAIDAELARLLAAPPPDEELLWAQAGRSGPAADEQQLLARILANPQDDESRLVYGDCLAERGDPRGELIMLQMKERRTIKQERRVRQLVREHGEAWIRPLDLVVNAKTMRFQRGFLHECEVSFSTKKQKRELIDHPLWSTVQVLTARDDDIFLHHASHLKQVRGITPAGLSAMAALEQPVPLQSAGGAPRPGRKGRVGLRCDDKEPWSGALAVGALTSLHTLHLHSHDRGDVDTLMWLLDSALGRQLRRIEVGQGRLIGWERLMERHPALVEVGMQGSAGVAKLVRDAEGERPRMVIEVSSPHSGAEHQIAEAVEGYPVTVKLPELQIAYVGNKRLGSMDGFRRLARAIEDLFVRVVLPDGTAHTEGDDQPEPEPPQSPELLQGHSPAKQFALLRQHRSMIMALERPVEQLKEMVRHFPEKDRYSKLTDLAHSLASAACKGAVDDASWAVAAALREHSLEMLSDIDKKGAWYWSHTETALYHCLAGDWDKGLAVAQRIAFEAFPDDFSDHLNLVTAYRLAAVGVGASGPLPDYFERYDYYNYQNRRDLRQLLFGASLERLRRLCQAIHPWVAEDALLYHLGGRPGRREHRDVLRHFLSLDPEQPLAIFVPILERSPYDQVRVADWDLLGRLYDNRFTYRELDIATFGAHLVEVALAAAVRLLPHVDDPSTAERVQRWLRRARAVDATMVEQALSQPRFAALMQAGGA